MVQLRASCCQFLKQFVLEQLLGLWLVGPLGLDCIPVDPVFLKALIVLILIRGNCLGVPQSG